MPLLDLDKKMIRENKESKLELWEQGLFDKDVKELVDLIISSNNTAITKLSLNNNNIKSEGAAELARLPHLVEVNLEWNDVGDAGALALAQASQIQKVNLRRNCVTDAGAQALIPVCSQTVFELEGNPKVTKPTLAALAQKLQDNATAHLRTSLGMK